MIDPDNIIVPKKNIDTSIKIVSMDENDFLTWDLEDEKELKKYFKTIESEVRKSFEYKALVQYMKDHYNMRTSIFTVISNADGIDIRIELHHYPFTLYDVVTIVYRKRVYYSESLEVQMVAKEVTLLHYKLMIGLVPLTKTEHQLTHDGKLFIPVDKVIGRYDVFVNNYKPFCEAEQLETLERIEEYSKNESDLCQTTILDRNIITVDPQINEYKLPDLSYVGTSMTHRIDEIKQNGYKLPRLEDYQNINKTDSPKDRKSLIRPVYFEKENKK